MRLRTILLSAMIATLPLSASAQPRRVYQDPEQPVGVRVRDLLARMTVEEKVAQLVGLWREKGRLLDDAGRFDRARAAAVLADGIGQVSRPSDRVGQRATPVAPRTPAETAELVNAIQRYLLEETRLGIPALFHEEGLHGYAADGGTMFPQAIALASTWDPGLVERVYHVTAREMRARGVQQALTPVVDVARDPRWGRIEETFGEDPYLAARLGVAAVHGFQGHALPLAGDRVFATLKHMTGHGQPESGTNVGPAQLPERVLREVFFPPFERAVKEAGVMSVMASYNEIDGIPSHANRWLLTDVLRGEWGFEGFVVSDYEAVDELVRRHHVAEDRASAAAQALAAGVDVELPDPAAYPSLAALVRDGAVDEALLDRAVARVLRAKFLAGLFEHPYADPAQAEAVTDNEEARILAAEAARRALILLKNEGGLLPLDASALRRVAVVGPNAAEAILGGYSGTPRYTVSILDGVRRRLWGRAEVVYAEGARITETRGWATDPVTLPDPEANRRRIAEAAEAVRGADVAIVVVGDNEQTSREAWAEAHLGDRASLALLSQQDELVAAVLATGTPTVVVLIHGRPLAINAVAEHVPAILDGWYLGQETGTAVADVLFGDTNPGGKLPVSIPRSVGQLPLFYNHKPTARRGYLFETTEPLFPFGHGLSYTTFHFGAPRLAAPTVRAGEPVEVSVDVTNTGRRTGDEVVQLYVRDVVSSVTRPVKELRGFQRVTLRPQERRTITFHLSPEDLAFYDRTLQRVVEPGTFELMTGPDSRQLQAATLDVTGPPFSVRP